MFAFSFFFNLRLKSERVCPALIQGMGGGIGAVGKPPLYPGAGGMPSSPGAGGLPTPESLMPSHLGSGSVGMSDASLRSSSSGIPSITEFNN